MAFITFRIIGPLIRKYSRKTTGIREGLHHPLVLLLISLGGRSAELHRWLALMMPSLAFLENFSHTDSMRISRYCYATPL